MKSDAYIKIGNLAFYGWSAEFVGALILLTIMGFGVGLGYLIWGPK